MLLVLRNLKHFNKNKKFACFLFLFCRESLPSFNVNSSLQNGGLRRFRIPGLQNEDACLSADDSACNQNQTLPLFSSSGCSGSSSKSVLTRSYHDKPGMTDDLLTNVLCSIERSGPFSYEVHTNIEKLCKTCSDSAIAKLLQFLHSNGVFLNSSAYNNLLAATCERCDTELSIVIFKDLLVLSKGMSSKAYLNLAKAFENAEDRSLLFNCVAEVAQLTSHCGVLVLNRMIYAFGECRQIDKALLIFNHMKVLGCKPDLVTYNTVIGLLGRAGLVDDMLQEFVSMKEENVTADIITYNTLLNNLQKMGRFDLCLLYLRELDENGIILDLRTYSALIESFGRSGNVEEALGIFCAMKNKKVQPSIYIYRSLINNLKKMGKLKAAASLLDEMTLSLPCLVGPKDFKHKSR